MPDGVLIFNPGFASPGGHHARLSLAESARVGDQEPNPHRERRGPGGELLMEKMPYQEEVDASSSVTSVPLATTAPGLSWRHGLPTLIGSHVVLRELRMSDAQALYAAMSTLEVSRFLSPPPSSVAGFERFIAWSERQRASGQYVSFAVVSRHSDAVIGLFQIRSLEPAFGTAEWGFAIDADHWGTGAFTDGAELAISFAFEVLGTHRLEARAALRNGRGSGALRKIGAVQEGVLRRSFLRHGEFLDQGLWTILAEDWLEAKAVWGSRIVH